MIVSQQVQQYLNIHHPNIGKEVEQNLTSMKCSNSLIASISDKAQIAMPEDWEVQLIVIAASLLLCSPETVLAKCQIRRSSGVATMVGKHLGVSQQCISRKVDRAVHYYSHIAWCRESVDKIVKEVRSEREERR